MIKVTLYVQIRSKTLEAVLESDWRRQFWFRISGFESGVEGLVFSVPGFGFKVCGFGSKVWGFRFQG